LKPLFNAVIPRLLSTAPSETTKRSRRISYGRNPLGFDLGVTKNAQGTRSYARFDQDSEMRIPEAGKVRVTTDVQQEVDVDEERLVTRVEDVGIVKAIVRRQE
jgi:hypothetical protein